MEVMLKQVKTLNFQKFESFVNTLSYSDLNKLYVRFHDFIEKLFDNGMEDSEEYTTSLHVLIVIENAMEKML